MPATLSTDGMMEKRKSPEIEGKDGLSRSGGLWWLPEAMAELLVHGGPWPKLGPTGFIAKKVSMRFLVIFGSKEVMAKNGSGGPNCGLGPRWLASLAYGPYGPQTVAHGP
ncbi:hypothetical protein O181_044883 [Austropuccinia psidii MF-1]|uniref:Uncharacterized protein n=1 Tax=Austropuccinia psidii MF-1 TaxID=1389203 RepID=A0A9Q3DQY4_9BASI|nr:hypothetical protein [Austropuccinia psidii MF-1]